MRLANLLKDISLVPEQADKEISHLVLDSRKVTPGDLFLAVKGTQLDGRQYIPAAISKGAVAILVDAEEDGELIQWENNIPLIPIHQLQKHLGELAARFYDFPATKLRMIGVTGTSGKTSTTHFLAQMLDAFGVRCGLIGTIGSGFYGALGDAGLTTPDAISLQALLNQFVQDGAQAVAMEVSSHSIDQGRVYAIPYEIGIFTNLSQDHLDYHGDMETYAAVKRRFLAELPTHQVIINADDARGREWIQELTPHKSVWAYSVNEKFESKASLIYTTNVKLGLNGITAVVHTPWGSGELKLPLIGQFNLSNALAVLTALCVYGIPFAAVLQHFAQLKSVPGRMQTISYPDQPLVVVDYAHKPDALEKVLQALRAHTSGKLICVFGCGGDRDRGKRPLMAKIAEELADVVIVTNDNPRHEQPEAIAAEICQGFSHPDRVHVQLDRSKAIENSIQLATPNDCVLIAGKGAEHYQQIGDEKFPFDDVNEVSKYLCLDKQKI